MAIAPAVAVFASCALTLPGAALHAAPAPAVPCQGNLPAGWIGNDMVSNQQCFLSLLHGDGFLAVGALDPLGSQPLADGLTGAFSGEGPLGLREWHPEGPPPTAGDGLLDFSSAVVVESGHAGAAGELWWGRVAHGSYRCCTVGSAKARPLNFDPLHTANESESLLIAIGQESSVRRAHTLASGTDIRQFQAGRLGPWPAGATRLHYAQSAAPSVVSLGSLPVAPGTVSGASLDLSVPEQLSGTLRFSLGIAGQSSAVSIPLKRDVDEAHAGASPFGLPGHPYRLRHGRASGGKVLDCHAAPGSQTPGPCYFLDQEETRAPH